MAKPEFSQNNFNSYYGNYNSSLNPNETNDLNGKENYYSNFQSQNNYLNNDGYQSYNNSNFSSNPSSDNNNYNYQNYSQTYERSYDPYKNHANQNSSNYNYGNSSNLGFINQNGFGGYPYQPNFEDSSNKKNILNRAEKNEELKNDVEFDGNVRQYYLKYIDNNSALMPMSYRKKIDFINKLNLIIPVGCMFHMIMAYVNYIPDNKILAKKHFFFSSLLMFATLYYSGIFINQYQIKSYNELLNTYSEQQIKEMVDKTILINRTL